jgi:hypothetical protein
VPWTSNRFSCWLRPVGANVRPIEVFGTALVLALDCLDGTLAASSFADQHA